jgi:2-methylcitrate dehydratase PrpD
MTKTAQIKNQVNFEKRMAEFVRGTEFDDLPDSALDIVKKMVLADIGTTIAGAYADGCLELVDFYRRQGGSAEASLLIHGGRVPAQNAALVNAVMSRVLDFCDAIAPGPYISSSVIPAALVCAELKGGCSGREFLTAWLSPFIWKTSIFRRISM